MRKKLSEITRAEWIGIAWIEVSEMGDEDRFFLGDYRRTPTEAAQAREEWDSTAEEREACNK